MGASSSSILFKHALRNAGIPVVTVLGLSFVGALSGAVFVEAVFSLPGLGSALVLAAQYHDIPVVEAVSLYFTVIVALVNLVVDCAYVVFGPPCEEHRVSVHLGSAPKSVRHGEANLLLVLLGVSRSEWPRRSSSWA